MAAPATQSNNAVGRRSLPSSFFTPLQKLGLYTDRQRHEGPTLACADPDGPDRDVAALEGTGLAADLAVDTRGAAGPVSAAFADVARRVWSEAPECCTAEFTDRKEAQDKRPRPGLYQNGQQSRALDSEDFSYSADGAVFAVVAPTPVPDIQSGPEEAHALAHDASNLLSALRLYSELLCFSGVLHERHRHYAEDLKLLSLRSERLIGRLVGMAEQVALAERLESAAALPAAHTTPVLIAGRSEISSLAPVLMRLRGLLGTLAHGALEVDMGDRASLPITAPAEAVERILVNLVSNAATAIRGGGAVRIRAGVHSEASPGAQSGAQSRAQPECEPGEPPIVVLTVDDSGCGMSAAEVQAALGAAVSSRRYGLQQHGPGRHGLGLSIVRELVASSGGRLMIYSRPGTGTRIEIHWRATAQVASPASEPGREEYNAEYSAEHSREEHQAEYRPGEAPGSLVRSCVAVPIRVRPQAEYPAAFPAASSGGTSSTSRAGLRAASEAAGREAQRLGAEEREAEGAVA
jgi:two-component sensor histidine kinase